MLVGADPMQPEALWQKLYSGSKMTGRRGAVICAIGALDMALWDLKAKALGKPVCELLGGSIKNPVTPYASLLPVGDTVAEQRESLIAKTLRVCELGFKAAKLEVCINGPYSHNGLQAPDEEGVAIVAACREAVGPDFTLMVDVAYAWPSAEHALRVLEMLAPYNLYFLETPIDIDDIEGHALLAERSPIPIAAGEWQNTHWEFVELADRGKLAVLQPDVGRVGGFTEALKVCRLAEARQRRIVPHCWKSAIGIAASAHLAASTTVCPYIEFLPAELSESPLRRELTTPEFTIRDGLLQLSERPGLGIELNRDAIERFSVA
jgi:L-alanine-DL-glutamate epimerase-like enolase superfamily enzyme